MVVQSLGACGCRFVGDNEGNLLGFDARQKQVTQAAINIHDRKINTVHVSPPEQLSVCVQCTTDTQDLVRLIAILDLFAISLPS